MINTKNTNKRTNRQGAALLVVLFIVMAITILSLGFLSRSDVELACGQNMILHTDMNYLAESGLEHAKGLILNPQDVDSEYWTGAEEQQLVEDSSDYYDVDVIRDSNDRCNYIIDCNAYQLKNNEEIGRSSLSAELRLDPCIALWIGSDTALWSGIQINGDVHCAGTLQNTGVINGDVFANVLSGDIAGQHQATGALSLVWPRVTVEDFTSRYSTLTISSSILSSQAIGPYDPPRVCYRSGSLVLAGNVQIEGMLVVDGSLIVRGNGNVITAAKNLPAILVTSDLIIESGADLQINGLAVVDNKVLISADAADLTVLGGLFVQDILAETTVDSSGNDHIGILYNGPTWQPIGGQTNGALEFDGIDDKLEDPYAGSYTNGLSAITVSLWVKSDVTFQDRGILFTREPTGADEELGIRYDKTGAFGGGVSCIKASIRTNSGYTQIESTSNVQTTSWQHLTLVWESGKSIKLYINGQLNPLLYDRTPSGLSGTIAGVQKLMLGRGTKGEYWDGLFDDLRIYNRALDANDVSLVYNGLPDPTNVPITHWKLDEASCDLTATAAPARTAIVIWSEAGVQENWGQAVGAFFRSIRRK